MTKKELGQARNFALYLLVGLGILYALPLANSQVAAVNSSQTVAGPLSILAKFGIRVLPLAAAVALEFLIAAEISWAIQRFFAWKKSERIDIYCFVLRQFYKLATLLGIVFTLGIPYLLNPWIAAHLPHKLQLFPLIEKHYGFAAAAIVFVLIASCIGYWEHRIWHSRVLWPIHRFHHSATEYNLLTETRKHFTEVLSTPIFYTIPMAMLGAPVEFLMCYFAFMQFHGFISHSDSGISYGWVGRYLFADPHYHKIHHSTAAEHMNKNFASMLPIWDHIFRSHAHDERPIAVGVTGAIHYETLPYWRILIKDLEDFIGNLKTLKQNRPLRVQSYKPQRVTENHPIEEYVE